MDFTCKQYAALITALQQAGYRFITMEDYFSQHPSGEDRFVVLRHDVDLKPQNSLRFAQIEHTLGVRATYYFRVVPESNRPDIIRAIAALGHEIGYHYEDMSIAKGDTTQAMEHFKKWLNYFRDFYPVRTICMHGAPTKQWDGKDLWKQYDYRDCHIIGEPYFDVDYSQLLYLTDTGRRWDGYKVSVRDKIPVHQDRWNAMGWVFHSTSDIIRRVGETDFPSLLITTHPQRWTDSPWAWTKEYVLQTIKNVVKRMIILWKS